MPPKTALLSVMACFVSLGCGGTLPDEPERVAVSGAVAYAGQPVAEGEIRFVPTKGTEAPSCSAIITEGVYKAEFKGGVPVGIHRVEIRGYRPKGGAAASQETPGVPEGETVKEQFISAKYNANSRLELTVETGSGPITKNFDLAQ